MIISTLQRALASIALLSISAVANANVITQTATPISISPIELINANLAFAGWNAIACGGCTLTGVDFNVTGNESGTISLQNTSANAFLARGTVGTDFAINDLTSVLTIHDQYNTGNQTVAGNSTFTSPTLSNSNTVDSGLIAVGLAAYLASFSAQVSTSTSAFFAGGAGNINLATSTNASVSGTVTYTFVAPEPSTMA